MGGQFGGNAVNIIHRRFYLCDRQTNSAQSGRSTSQAPTIHFLSSLRNHGQKLPISRRSSYPLGGLTKVNDAYIYEIISGKTNHFMLFPVLPQMFLEVYRKVYRNTGDKIDYKNLLETIYLIETNKKDFD